jgi:hypothetical protein
MSSIISSKKYKIALFQVGLEDSCDSFDQTMNLLSKASLNFIKYNKKIDMSHFNPEQNCFYGNFNGYYTKSTIATIDFKTLIANIVSYAKENEGKTIMVGTNLNRGFNTNHNLDSIENQKIKLIYIIDEIKKYSNVELYLVGHSQGGLVNLETGIERNTKINKIVSISTPYAPVYLGERLIFLDFFFKLGGETAYSLFCSSTENISAYKASVEKLCSSSYFSDLKSRWNNLTIRPQLTVITGTAGHLYHVIPATGSGATYSPSVITKYSFDGLVKFSEQADIQNANFIHLGDHNLPCYSERTFAQSCCYCQNGIFLTCKKSCTASSISFSGTTIDVLFNLIDNAINGKDIRKFSNYKVVLAINAGLKQRADLVPEGYSEYYNIYSNEYNHKFIRYNLETISHLLVLLN